MDGYTECAWTGYEGTWKPANYVFQKSPYSMLKKLEDFEKYLHSYDAIIPVIQKQDRPTQIKMMKLIAKMFEIELGWDATPSQLSQALLRATGKWKD